MNKNKVKFIVDLVMFVDFILLAFSGFVLKFILPRGSGKFGATYFFLREDWLTIHDWTSLILIMGLILHLVLNWIWIKSIILSLFRRKK